MGNKLARVNPSTCATTYILSFNESVNSLVGAMNGILYAAGSHLHRVDLNIPSVTDLGVLPANSGGDMVFFNGSLYLSTSTMSGSWPNFNFINNLYQVNINNPGSSVLVGNLGSVSGFGMWVDYVACGTSHLYASNGSNANEVFFSPLSTTPHCNGSSAIDGAAATDEFLESDCTPLGVSIKSFETVCQREIVTLTWELFSEYNNDYFIIERSNDGGKSWSQITKVNSFGNSNNTSLYQYLDNSENMSSDTYYRLNQVDKDGTLKTIASTLSSCQGNKEIQIFPNPSSGVFTLLNLEEGLQVKIVDALGQEIISIQATSQFQKIDLSMLRSGVYGLTVLSSSFEKVFDTRIILIE